MGSQTTADTEIWNSHISSCLQRSSPLHLHNIHGHFCVPQNHLQSHHLTRKGILVIGTSSEISMGPYANGPNTETSAMVTSVYGTPLPQERLAAKLKEVVHGLRLM